MSELAYRVAPGDISLDRWVVVSIQKPGERDPAPVMVGLTREKADKECARLNAVAEAFEVGNAERRDAVLGRMMRQSRA